MSNHHYIACDLGAESGRVLLGTLDNDHISLEEIHRFPNGGVTVNDSLRWDIPRILTGLNTGVRKVASRKIPIAGLSCDSWGVDYVLFRGNGRIITPPYHYRDKRTDNGLERAFDTVSADEIYAETGIQFMPINTLYQLHDDLLRRQSLLSAAELFLNIGDYFNLLFSGVARAEQTLASTTQMYNPVKNGWSWKLIGRFGFPKSLFPEIVPSGTVLGPLLRELAAQTHLADVKVIAGCSHDTASAVGAIPAQGQNWAYLSSGTWSLLGIESPQAFINKKSRQLGFTNEVGFRGNVRFLKNITGLWIIQECRRWWAREGTEHSYDELTAMAEKAEPLKSLVDPSDPSFMKPDEMPMRIVDYCRKTDQSIPSTNGEIIRCVLESLALLYRRTVDQIEEITQNKLKIIHIVGGGSKNGLLNQFAADATGRDVVAGPVECTGIGNILIQAIALEHIPSIEKAREIVRKSFPLLRYEPKGTNSWKRGLEKFSDLLSRRPG